MAPVEAIENRHAVDVTVFAGENGRAARGANRIDHETIAEAHPFFRNAIDVGCFVHLAAVGADRVRRMIVRHDENDIWPLRFRFCGLSEKRNVKKREQAKEFLFHGRVAAN